MEGMDSSVKIVKEPIYAQDDLVVFLLVFQWYPNTVKTLPKIKKGSFSSQKQGAVLKIRFQKPRLQDEDLVSIIYLLSEKVYIGEKHIDQFSRVISNRHEISSKHQNCLTAVVIDSGHKRNMTNMASTVDETKYHFYYNDYIPSYDLDKIEKNFSATNNNDKFMNRMTLIARSSYNYDKSPVSARKSMGSKELIIQESGHGSSIKCNLEKVKKFFSALEYIITDAQITIDMIIFHLSDSEHNTIFGFKFDTLESFMDEWPRYKDYTKLYNLNKSHFMEELIQQTCSNYNMLLQMELQEINNIKLQSVYQNISEFNCRTVNQFMEAAKEYIAEPDYQKYIAKLEAKLGQLQYELISSYAQTKYEYGSRILKNIEKKGHKPALQSYTLMKLLGKEQINGIQISYKLYKQFVQEKLDIGFKEFINKKYGFRSRILHKFSQNFDEEELNQIQNRIQICEQKKKMLDAAIQLEIKEAQSLKMMLKLLQKEDYQDSRSLGSQSVKPH